MLDPCKDGEREIMMQPQGLMGSSPSMGQNGWTMGVGYLVVPFLVKDYLPCTILTSKLEKRNSSECVVMTIAQRKFWIIIVVIGFL